MDNDTDGGIIMAMNTSNIVGYIQGIFYPAVVLIIATLADAYGAGGSLNGTLPVGLGLVVSALLSAWENRIERRGKGALFGFAN